MKILKSLIVSVVVLLAQNSWAGYNANMSGVVTQVLTYTGGDNIFFRLDNQPTAHPECKTDYFSIDASVPVQRRQQVLARLLSAHATGKPINIGYDKEGDCSHTRIRVHRVG